MTTRKKLLVLIVMQLMRVTMWMRAQAFAVPRQMHKKRFAYMSQYLATRPLHGGAPKRRRWRKDMETGSTPSTLEWETFDYGDSPKWDTRFTDDHSMTNSGDEEELNQVIQEEAKQDEETAERLNQYHNALNALSPKVVQDATHALKDFVAAKRMDRINDVLNKRTQNVRFLFENPSNPSNVWACLRTIDSFGVQHVDLIIDNERYTGKASLVQRRGMRTAMGSAQWLTLRNYLSTEDAVTRLKNAGYKIYASDLNPNSKDIREIQWNHGDSNDDDDTDAPICIVMGNEHNGISQEMRDLADVTFTLPMSGFAESFNLSVATAITLAHLSACSKEGEGPLRPGDLPEHELQCLKLKGILNSLANKRIVTPVLDRVGIKLPEEIHWV